MQTTNDYSGRLLDLECLKSVRVPSGAQSVKIALTPEPAIVAGIQKLVQRYVLLFLTPYNSIMFSQDTGTLFLDAVSRGTIINYGQLMAAFSYANTLTLQAMTADTSGLPDDEIITGAGLLSHDISHSTNTLSLTIGLINKAGETTKFIVPTTISRV